MNNEPRQLNWPSVEEQQAYWRIKEYLKNEARDWEENNSGIDLDRTEATTDWYDHRDDGRSDGYGESYAERNV